MTDSRLDSRGCLTMAGLIAIRRAPPGGAPAELASHLAACARCQDRLLATERGDTPRRTAPRPMRAAVIGLAILLLGILALASLWWRAVSR